MDLIAIRPLSLYHDSRQGLISYRPKHLLPTRNRKKKPRLMSKADQLSQYGLRVAIHSYAQSADCSICQERLSNAVITPCQHIYCLDCIYEWLGRSTRCPECRKELDQEKKSDSCSPSTITAATPSGRFSSSHWINSVTVPQVSEFKWHMESFGPDPQDLSDRLAALDPNTTADEPSPRASGETGSTATPPAVREPGRRQWCLQRQMPLRNRAAHPLVFYGLPGNKQDTFSSGLVEEACAVAACLPPFHARQPSRAISMPLPLPPPNNGLYSSHSEHNRNGRLITVNAKEQLSRMWQSHESMADDIEIPIRCRAMAKCVWREWREFLQVNDGHKLYAGDLLKSLYSSFEQTIVDYGWETCWRRLPASFIEVMRSTARAAIESEPFSIARTHTL